MATGKVKWFNNAKGFGFILPDEGSGDLFAHYSSIQMDGYKTLKAGQDVEYDLLDGPKGQHAANIRARSDVRTSGDHAPGVGAAEAGDAEAGAIAVPVEEPLQEGAESSTSLAQTEASQKDPTVEFPEEIDESLAHPETG